MGICNLKNFADDPDQPISARSCFDHARHHRSGVYHPTGADTLPGGDVVVLERAFTRLGTDAARLIRLEGGSIAPGNRLEGRVLAEFLPPVTVDNFEGVAVRRDEDGETLVYVLSDDNFKPEQRTLLLMFELEERRQ